MTLEEAKKILKSEGFHMALANKVIYQNGAIREFEKPEVCEAIKVANANKWTVGLSPIEWDEREARSKKEYEKNTKAPGPGEEQPKEGNPALKESASQFNDALLNEQAKKIKRLGKEIARLNGIIHDKNEEIKRKTKGCCELITENVDLKKKLSDKNAILSDVAEELRLSKIREKNLTVLGLKYIEETKELKEQLTNKIGNGIDWKRNADAIQLYVNRASHERLWNSINQDICNEKELSFIINHEGKRVKYALRFDGTDIIYECSDPDKKPRIPTPEEPKHDKSFEDFINKTIDNYNRRAAILGCVGSNDGNGIFDQIVGVDIAEEGADLTGVIIIKSEK